MPSFLTKEKQALHCSVGSSSLLTLILKFYTLIYMECFDAIFILCSFFDTFSSSLSYTYRALNLLTMDSSSEGYSYYLSSLILLAAPF